MFADQLTLGHRAADRVAKVVGSWRFIIGQSLVLTVWALLNVTAWVRHWDPYPFILMNLVLSLQAAYTAPVIMMSQNNDEPAMPRMVLPYPVFCRSHTLLMPDGSTVSRHRSFSEVRNHGCSVL